MNFAKKHAPFLILILILLIALNGCAPVPVRPRPMEAPEMPAFQPTVTMQEKVVSLATQTSVPPDQPTLPPTPARELMTPTAVRELMTPTPITLAGLGVETETYRDELAGLAIDYPKGWIVNAPTDEIKQTSMGYSISIRSGESPSQPKQQEGLAPGIAAMDVVIMNDTHPASLEEAVALRKEQWSSEEFPPEIVSEEYLTLSDGTPAARFLLETRNGRAGELITIIDGRMILVAGFGEMALYEPIARSVRATGE